MSRRAVADILRDHGAAWREANRGHVSLGQLKVMSAIERCRTAALGGHVARCENESCSHTLISYNSCRNRHCPKCQGAAAREWLAAREAELLPVGYFHVVYTLPARLRDVAYQNKRVIYDLLMKAAAETTLTIAADPKRLGARIGITAVLHTFYGAFFVKGVPQGSYPFSRPSRLCSPWKTFLRPDPRSSRSRRAQKRSRMARSATRRACPLRLRARRHSWVVSG